MHDILTRLKAQPRTYPTIDISYSSTEPLTIPVFLNLPSNGFRLQFDGPDQRLRLIEVLDFTKTQLRYNDKDLFKLPEASPTPAVDSGPAFRQIYNKMGLTNLEEYIPPVTGCGSDQGILVWSYPGVAFTFPVQHANWSPKVDFVTLLSYTAPASALSMAIFDGRSWEEARSDIMTRACPYPRSLALSSRGRESRPDEVDLVRVGANGKIVLDRRASPPFQMVLGKTTPQDLVAELGPPDAIYRKYDRRLSIHKTPPRDRKTGRAYSRSPPTNFDGLVDTDESSTHTSADDSDVEDHEMVKENTSSDLSAECFYNYFDHGFDVFISYPANRSPTLAPIENEEYGYETNTKKLVATKMLLHGNIPGCYPFNRYRRSRWVINFQIAELDINLDSETPYTALSESLSRLWPDDINKRAMVLNRDFWGDSPGSSCELLGSWEDSTNAQKKGMESNAKGGPGAGNTKLYGFPGLLFEVLKNDVVSCLTVY